MKSVPSPHEMDVYRYINSSKCINERLTTAAEPHPIGGFCECGRTGRLAESRRRLCVIWDTCTNAQRNRLSQCQAITFSISARRVI
jgi:hypothetical protein